MKLADMAGGTKATLAGQDGAPGQNGADGTAGAPGATGAPGAPGARWFQGAGVPDAGVGNVGDWYIATGASDVYEKTGASVWTLRANIKGANGSSGINGVSGYELVFSAPINGTKASCCDSWTVYAAVNCPVGKKPLGGGYVIGGVTSGPGGVPSRMLISSNRPTATGWSVDMISEVDLSVIVFATCATTL